MKKLLLNQSKRKDLLNSKICSNTLGCYKNILLAQNNIIEHKYIHLMYN